MLIPVEMNVDVKHHIDLMAEQGRDVSDLRPRLEKLNERIEDADRARSEEWNALAQDVLASEAKWSTDEPSDLETILTGRPAGTQAVLNGAPTGDALADRIAGGWLGRIAGCIIGKPVECLMREKDSRGTLRRILEDSDEWPLDGFVSERTIVPYWESIGSKPSWFQGGNPSLREYITHAPADDDLNYTLVSLKLVKRFGRNFSPDDVLNEWVRNLPFSAVCTAEKIAYRNRVMQMRYPETATFLNPYREWIGAQIRTDLYGYIAPGRPEEAARMAWSDAACSHTKNGIYGAMWVSAAIAAAFVEDNPEAIILAGLQQVPEQSRFTDYMLKTIDAAKANADDFEATFDTIEALLDGYHCVHTIPNACIVAAALLHGGADFGRVACLAVMGGYDTDCNGATAGSIVGTMLGAKGIDERWTTPFNDIMHSSVSGYNVMPISTVIEETVSLAESS